MMKTITLVSMGKRLPEWSELHRLEAADEFIRASLFGDTLNTDLLDERFMENVPRLRHLLYKSLPNSVSQVLEAFLVRGDYDAVISWAEHLGLPFAMLLKLTGSHVPHIAIFSWISKPKKAGMLRKVHSHIDRLILMSTVQRDFALNVLHIPPSKVALLKWPVDQKFWRPMGCEADMICSVGSEMRDYPTLVEAVRGMDVDCHIAAGAQSDVVHPTIDAIWRAGPLPQNVTVGKKSCTELRTLYARSRFVVIPLHPSETDHGTTSILEAMAMGKPVICSRTEGQVDVIQEGCTGVFVPPGDSHALRDAIHYLWGHPDEAEKMGKAGRKYIEENHSLDQFVENVKSIVGDAISEYKNA
ncbi:MAG: glycosyltransferase family 4 protein [Bacteroidota bacterium]